MRNCRRCIRLYFCHRFCFIRKQLYTRYKSNQISVNCVYTTLFSSRGTTHKPQNGGLLLLTVTGSTGFAICSTNRNLFISFYSFFATSFLNIADSVILQKNSTYSLFYRIYILRNLNNRFTVTPRTFATD